jgi:hypothetical protein
MTQFWKMSRTSELKGKGRVKRFDAGGEQIVTSERVGTVCRLGCRVVAENRSTRWATRTVGCGGTEWTVYQQHVGSTT